MRRVAAVVVPVTALLAAALSSAGCVFPATEVLVVVSTDLDPAVPMTLTMRVARAGDGGGGTNSASAQVLGPYARFTQPDARPPDGGVTLPLSFAITPGARLSHATPVELLVEADADGVVLRRRASFVFSSRQTTVVRILLSGRCATRATECLTPGVACTVQQQCEERGLTCGDRGECVPVAVDPSRDRDATLGDPGMSTGCGEFDQVCCGGAGCRAPLACVGGRCARCTPGNEACCDGAELRPDGTACRPTSDPCRRAGVCRAGECGPITDAPNGTECAPARNACERAGVCTGGVCGARTVLADGARWGTGAFNRCCGGQPVVVNTEANCNMCGLRCAGGQQCQFVAGLGQHYCTCGGASAQCAPQICRIGQSSYNNLCACRTSAECPRGGTCVDVNFGPNHCRY